VAYDWDLDEVLQRQMEEALGQAGLDDSYSDESGEGDEERDAAASVAGKNKKASLDRCASGYDQDGESSDAVAVGDRSRDRKQQQPTKKRRVRRDSTSSSSSPSSSSDSNGSDNDAGNNGRGEKQKPATQPRSENSPPKPQPKAQPAKPAAANARPNASTPVQPSDARHTLSDRQVLFLVVVVGVVCATIGAALAGFLVFRAMDSKLAALLLAQQQQQAPAAAAKPVGDL
jgi:FtsZ-interacting cell division protein ZipA